jgi:hypothetical protein
MSLSKCPFPTFLLGAVTAASALLYLYHQHNRQRSSLIKKESKTSISDSLINSPHSYEKELKVALECVHLAGEKLREALESDKLIHSKGRANDFVTETDRSNEELIFTKLRQHFPHHKFIGEVWPAFAPSLVTCSCLSLGNKCDIRSPRAHR